MCTRRKGGGDESEEEGEDEKVKEGEDEREKGMDLNQIEEHIKDDNIELFHQAGPNDFFQANTISKTLILIIFCPLQCI